MTTSSRTTGELQSDELGSEPDDGVLDALAAIRPAQEDALAQSLGRAIRRTLVGTPTQPFRLGRFTILDLLGGGAMGTVFVAYDPELDRKVALKVLRVQGETGRHAVLRESRALARLSHPRIVTVHEVGVVDEQVFVVMEYIRGCDLRAWLRDDHSPEEILTVVTEAARGLAAAHEADVVHLDLKPDNLLVDDEGHARLIDFGVARFLEELSTDEEIDATPHVVKRSGTPAYMAPERLRGDPGGPSSDQYSLCVVAWEALFGQRPGEDDKPPASTRISGRVVEALRRGLRPDPSERFDSMRDLADALEPTPARRPGRWLSGLAALGLVLGAYALGQRRADVGPELCPSPWASIDETWNDARAETIATAFLGADAPFVEGTWNTASSGLELYASAWNDSRRRACEAPRDSDTDERLERRLACLEDRRLHLDALLERFALADHGTVTRAVDAVEALPPLEACDDPSEPDASLAGARSDRNQRAELRRALARLRAQLTAGSRSEATSSVEQTLANARALGHPPLVAEVLITAASLANDGSKDDLEQGVERAWEALEIAIEHEQAWLAANAILQLVSLQRDLDPTSTREELLDLADAFARRLDESPGLDFDLAIARGNGLLRAGRCADAIEEYERARAIAERAERPRWSIDVLANLGNCYLQLGRYELAADHLSEAGAIAGTLLGAEHPWFLRYHNTLGNLHLTREETELGITHYQRGLEVTVANYGEEHPMAGLLRNNIGMAYKDLGRFEEAVAVFEAAASSYERIRGPEDPGFALAHCGLADALHELGRHERALASAQRATAIHARVLPEGSCTALACRAVHANVLEEMGRAAEVIELFGSDLARYGQAQCDPYTRGKMELFLAEALWAEHGVSARARVLELLDSAIPDVDEPARRAARELRAEVAR